VKQSGKPNADEGLQL